jgi:hypothetical protein
MAPVGLSLLFLNPKLPQKTWVTSVLPVIRPQPTKTPFNEFEKLSMSELAN